MSYLPPLTEPLGSALLQKNSTSLWVWRRDALHHSRLRLSSSKHGLTAVEESWRPPSAQYYAEDSRVLTFSGRAHQRHRHPMTQSKACKLGSRSRLNSAS